MGRPRRSHDWLEIIRIASENRSRELQKRCGVEMYPQEVMADAAHAAIAAKGTWESAEAASDVMLAWERAHTLAQEVTH